MKDLLRTSRNRAEIVANIRSKLCSSKKVTIWQKDELGNRKHFSQFEIDEIFEEEGVFTLSTLCIFVKEFDQKEDIFMLLENNDFTFKTKIAHDQKQMATFQIPKELNLKELRAYPRKYFKFEDKKHVEVVFVTKSKNNAAKPLSLSCPIINLSQGGACIVITRETIKNIDVEAGVLIKITTQFNKAIIRNARIFLRESLSHEDRFAIGLEFHQPLSAPV